MPKALISKTRIAELVRTGRAHECFTHSQVGTFDVSLMLQVAPFLYERFSSDINPELIAQIKATRDWEQERINTLTFTEVLFPTLWILDPTDNTHILVDGTHRLIALYERFNTFEFRGWMAPLSLAIRPHEGVLLNSAYNWGRMEVRDGKLYNRSTGEEIK